MVQITIGELLLYGGIGIMTLSALGGIAAAVLLRISGKRLRLRLEAEYGKKRH